MTAVAFDIDAYGKYARTSALADYVELLALAGKPILKATLADYIADNQWTLRELVLPCGRGLEDVPGTRDALEAADIVFSHLNERVSGLAHKYPFVLDERILKLRPGFDLRRSPYLAVLAIATAHAYRFEAPAVPHQLFEATVANVLSARGLLCVNFGAVRRDSANFEEALEKACMNLCLFANPNGAPRMARAQDENVDVVCHLPWGDMRSGVWVMLGQVTCAKSEQWERKIKEPSASLWSGFVRARPFPTVFLAVPHHVESNWLERLVYDANSVVLDRLRLVNHKHGVLEEEEALIRFVRDVDIEGPI